MDESDDEERDEEEPDEIECYAGEYTLKAEQSGGGALLPQFAEQVKHVEEGMPDQGLDKEVHYDGRVFSFADALAQAVRDFAESIKSTLPDQEVDRDSVALEVATGIFIAAIASFNFKDEEHLIKEMIGDADVAKFISELVTDDRIKAVIQDLLVTEDGLFRQILFAGWNDTQERFLVVYAEFPAEEEDDDGQL